jgi:hypothetical protein
MLFGACGRDRGQLDEWPEGTAGVAEVSAYPVRKRRDHNQEADHGDQHDVLIAWHDGTPLWRRK